MARLLQEKFANGRWYHIPMAHRIIIGLAGFAGTGKSNLARHLSEKYHFQLFEGSALLRHAAAERGLTLDSRQSYEQLNRQLQADCGLSWATDIMLASNEGRLLFSGHRSPSDAQAIHEAGGVIVALSCPPEICLTRIDTTDPKNPRTIAGYLEAQRNDTSNTEFGSNTPWVIAHADYTINTSGPTEATCAKADQLVEAMLRL